MSYLTVGGELLLDDGIDKDTAAITSLSSPTPTVEVATGFALPSLALLRRLEIADDDEPIMPNAPAAGRL